MPKFDIKWSLLFLNIHAIFVIRHGYNISNKTLYQSFLVTEVFLLLLSEWKMFVPWLAHVRQFMWSLISHRIDTTGPKLYVNFNTK